MGTFGYVSAALGLAAVEDGTSNLVGAFYIESEAVLHGLMIKCTTLETVTVGSIPAKANWLLGLFPSSSSFFFLTQGEHSLSPNGLE